MNKQQFDKVIHVIRCLNTAGYILKTHTKYRDGGQTMFFEPMGVTNLDIDPKVFAKILSNDLPSGMCVTCIRLDSVQLHILPKQRKGTV